ncbi:MAG TPA: hypothetical protein VFO57_10980 [Burkholderiales bacterium]|nr:hypothetical protein [Burkholderiales bacterium]
MAKAKKRAGIKKSAKKKKPVARRRPVAKRKAAKRGPTTAAPIAPRPVVIPGAWPFPMGSK